MAIYKNSMDLIGNTPMLECTNLEKEYQLKGKIFLIQGNHDSDKVVNKLSFADQTDKQIAKTPRCRRFSLIGMWKRI